MTKTNRNEYMRRFMAVKRARKTGFNVDLAIRLHDALIERGYSTDDARWAVYDAAGRGVFGTLPTRFYNRRMATR